jgi:hypothetical protein
MPDPDGLDVHDVRMSHTPVYDNNGRMQNNTVVTYQVGDHGPFHLVYGPGAATPAQVNGDIDRHVADLRAIVKRP